MEKIFNTAAVRADLPTRSVRSGFINLGSQGTQVVLGIGATMVLARLLTPADFGLYAMAGTLILFVGRFRDFGLPMATMYREAVNHREYSALFWLYQRFNVLITVFMLGMAPVVAWFYGQPALSAVTLVMAAGVFALGLAVQHESLLKRQMRFGTLTAIDVAGTVLGIIVGITVALAGAGYWALVMQFMTMCLSKAIGCWICCDWRPARVGSGDTRASPGLRELLTYGREVTAARVVKHLGRSLDQVLVGYFAGAQSLGLYHHADRWANFPVNQLYPPLKSVAVTGLSRVQNEPELYRAYAYRGLLPLFSLTMPALAFLFVEADRVVEILLGPQWAEAVPLFRILLAAAFVGKVTPLTVWLYLSAGETRRQLHWDLISTPIMIAAVSTGAVWGVRGVAIGFLVGNCLLAYPSVWFCLRRSHLRMRDLAGMLLRPATASIAAAALVFAVQRALPPGWHPLVVLPVQFATFCVSYLLLWIVLPGGWAAARGLLRLTDALPWKRRARPPQPELQAK